MIKIKKVDASGQGYTCPHWTTFLYMHTSTY